jgi:HPt (histidine-containing phosphotransfer) domain-containing protein
MIETAFLADHPETIPTLTRWFRTQWPEYYAEYTLEDMAQDFYSEANRTGLDIRLIAFADGELAGTITLRDQATWTLPEYHPGLGGLLVVGQHRGRGIGTASTLRRLFGARAGSEAPAATDATAPEPAPSGVASALIDRGALDAALRAMPRERLAELLEAFFAQGPEMVQRLRLALRDGHALDLRVNAHAARGAALNFGLSALAQTAQALHEGATHVPAHEIARLVQRFEDQLASSREACAAAGLLEPLNAPGV